MRPEQELVVKKQGWELMVLRRGIMGVSMVPFGDLSGSGEVIDASVAAFLFSNSIVSLSKNSLSLSNLYVAEERRTRV